MKNVAWQTYRLHECERCGGDLCIEEDKFGSYALCLQCGGLWDGNELEEEGEAMLESDKVIPGCDLWSKDGSRLGRVQEVTIGEFQVRPDRGRRYWIPDELVYWAQDLDVVLKVATSDVDAYKRVASSARV